MSRLYRFSHFVFYPSSLRLRAATALRQPLSKKEKTLDSMILSLVSPLFSAFRHRLYQGYGCVHIVAHEPRGVSKSSTLEFSIGKLKNFNLIMSAAATILVLFCYIPLIFAVLIAIDPSFIKVLNRCNFRIFVWRVLNMFNRSVDSFDNFEDFVKTLPRSAFTLGTSEAAYSRPTVMRRCDVGKCTQWNKASSKLMN